MREDHCAYWSGAASTPSTTSREEEDPSVLHASLPVCAAGSPEAAEQTSETPGRCASPLRAPPPATRGFYVDSCLGSPNMRANTQNHGLHPRGHQGREPRQGRAREARHGLPQDSTRISQEYLRANGYSKSCDLAKEVGSGLEKLELADNVDLGSVIREFDAYYQLKLGRPPKL